MKTRCQIGSIREIHDRLISEGYNISQHTLRIWIKQGMLPAIYTGTKALISYENVMLLIQGPTPAFTTP